MAKPLTSSIGVAEIRKPPDIGQIHCKSNHGQEKIGLLAPNLSLWRFLTVGRLFPRGPDRRERPRGSLLLFLFCIDGMFGVIARRRRPVVRRNGSLGRRFRHTLCNQRGGFSAALKNCLSILHVRDAGNTCRKQTTRRRALSLSPALGVPT